MKRLRDRQLRIDRVALGLFGLILIALSVLGLLLSGNVVQRYSDTLEADSVLYNGSAMSWARANELAIQIGLVVAAVILLALGLAWLLLQIPPIRHNEQNHFQSGDSDYAGTNIVAGDALAHALEADLESSSDISRVRAEFRTDESILRLRIDISESAQVDELVNDIIDPAINRIVCVGELGELSEVKIDLRPVEVKSTRAA